MVNSGGYLEANSDGTTVYCYSPIDLAVYIYTVKLLDLPETDNLAKWFTTYKGILLGDHYCYIAYLQGKLFYSESLSVIKARSNPELISELKKLAPLSMAHKY
jgi:hypothetical protein